MSFFDKTNDVAIVDTLAQVFTSKVITDGQVAMSNAAVYA